ncbi:unnamed protein product [Lymnaea stagnalis]|uniref:Tyrosine specific protein phosphatases domain-containing protein n=1 Tax=Lymnaea stagnalis TaxID=6523 RepID=A0AAV2HJX9_LYMST
MAAAVRSSLLVPKLDSVPNLRILCTRSTSSIYSKLQENAAAVYRSSKPDRLISEELAEFRKLGIKCIIDFRSKEEYLGTDGHCLLDKEYSLYKVCVPKENYKAGEKVKCEIIFKASNKYETSSKDKDLLQDEEFATSQDNPEPAAVPSSETFEKKHYLINFFRMTYVFAVFNRLPWHLWLLGILYFLLDLLRRNKFKNFSKFFAKKALNKTGMYGQYVDIVEFSQSSICSALKLLSDPNNLPALINCAHGKDRTGIVSALVLTCLGMPKDYVAEEYALSTEGLEPVKHLVYKDIVEKYHLREEFCKSDAETMRSLLTYIEQKYTSVEGYMCHIGFGTEEQQELKQNLEAFVYSSSELDRDAKEHEESLLFGDVSNPSSRIFNLEGVDQEQSNEEQ